MKQLLSVLLLVTSAFAAEIPSIPAATAAKLVAEGKAVLIDVREPAEWAETGVADPALLLPKSDFDQGRKGAWQDFLAQARGRQIIAYCRSGKRAGVIAQALAAEGFAVGNAGGFKDWEAAGLPTRKVEAPK